MCYRCLAIFLLLGLAILAAGCSGGRELDEVAFITGMAADATEDDNKIDVTFRVAIPRALGTEGAAGQKNF